MLKKIMSDKVNYSRLNEVLNLSSKILKVAYILLVIIAVYAITLIMQAWNVIPTFIAFLHVLSPLFIGIAFAWLLDPLANYLVAKGIKRSFATILIILLFMSLLALTLAAFLPLMRAQIDDFVTILPNLMNTLTDWVNNFLRSIDLKNATTVQNGITKSIEKIGDDLMATLPNATIKVVTSFFSGLGTFILGLVIGFYLLLNFNKVSKNLYDFLPQRYKEGYQKITNEVNTSLRSFVNGTLLISFIIFVSNAIGFTLIGLKSPILFALICGVTNLIPYIGPFIGGIPAVIVGLTISPALGLLTFVVIFVTQTLESTIVQPVILSKATKLHPVTIIVGLLIFGKLFGIMGMILATPIIVFGKIILSFIVNKYNLFNWNELEN